MWLRGELFYYILYARVYSSSLDFYVNINSWAGPDITDQIDHCMGTLTV